MKNSNKEIVPAKFKKIKKNGKDYWVLIFNFADFIIDEKPAKFQEDISKDLDALLKSLKQMMPDGKPSKVKRGVIWEMGDMIIRKRQEIAEKYGIYITNITEAIGVMLGLAPRTVNFFIQFRLNVQKKELDEDIPWKVYQISLLLKDKSKLKECIELYKKGELKNTSEVLEYVQKHNKNQ